MIGTVAQMLRVDALDDSRYAIVAVGTRRIRVNAWLPDDPYPLADVDDWPDENPDAEGLDARIAAAHDRVRSALALAAELDEVQVDLADTEISDDPLVASYHLASLAPIGPADRFRLLAASGPTERLDILAAVLDDVEAMLNFRLS
jgi:Lon protease-like protein